MTQDLNDQTISDHARAAFDHEQAVIDHQRASEDAAKKEEEKKKEEQKKHDEEKRKNKPLWPWLVGGLIVATFVLIVLYIVLAPHPRQRTDDAYVSVHYASIAPRVAGQVVAVAVDDNQTVRAGQLLLRLDDRDFRAALRQAEAALASDQARTAQALALLERQPDLILQAQAQVASVRARIELSSSDARRYTNLAKTGAGTEQQRQQADVTERQNQASLASAEAQLNAERHQLDALRADYEAAQARVGADEASVAQARLNLSYVDIVAPFDGTVDQRSVQAGNYVAPGAPVMTVVPLDAVYVVANYREVALHHMRPGQPVRIHVDAYDIDLDGIVDSLPASSGAAYSPIPPNNATGNFTKIVQRFPVKIIFAPHQRLARLVRVGMSVETTVDTNLDDVVGLQSRRDERVTSQPPSPP